MAFEQFPKQIWGMILEQLNDSSDVLNTFQAYPELENEGVLSSSKKVWLFDRVVYFIIPFFNENEVKTLRLVCKKFCWAVDNCLENHSCARPFSNPSQNPPITGQYFLPEASPRHYELSDYFRGFIPYLNSSLPKFLKDFEGHLYSERNPFVGRSIKLYCPNLSSESENQNNSKFEQMQKKFKTFPESFLEFCTLLFEMLVKFGEHIWFLEIYQNDINEADSQKFIMDVLKLVPNLKSLKISDPVFHFDNLRVQIFAKFPQLPFLKTLEIDENKPDFIKPLLHSNSGQVRRLILGEDSWKLDKFPRQYLNLTELKIQASDFDELTKFLDSVEAPNLFKLDIHIRGDVDGNFLNKFAKCLSHFRKITSLSFGALNCTDDVVGVVGKLQKSEVIISTIKSLNICLWGLNQLPYNKLFDCFPSLEYLKIIVERNKGNKKRKVYVKKLTKLMPNLKCVTYSFQVRRGHYYSEKNQIIYT